MIPECIPKSIESLEYSPSHFSASQLDHYQCEKFTIYEERISITESEFRIRIPFEARILKFCF